MARLVLVIFMKMVLLITLIIPIDGAEAMPGSNPAELVIIDASVKDAAILASKIRPDMAVQLLTSNRPCLASITDIISDYHDLRAIHLITHGRSGRLTLSHGGLVSSGSRNFRVNLEKWAKSLRPGADILLYGCDIAADTDGILFVNAMAELTGADVAASDDVTGHEIYGADLDLEYRTGLIDAAIVIPPGFVLATLTDWTFDWESLGWTTGSTATRTYTDVDGSGIDVRVSFSGSLDDVLTNFPALNNEAWNEDLPGDVQQEFNFRMDLDNLSETISMTFEFFVAGTNPPQSTPAEVYVKGFMVKDIDRQDFPGFWFIPRSQFHDVLLITGTTLEDDTVDPDSIVFFDPTVAFSPDTDEIRANNNLNNNLNPDDTQGWASANFAPTAIKAFTITYDPGDGGSASNPTQQWYWLSDFVFSDQPAAATAAVISDVFAYEENGRSVVEWQTVSEAGTLGFFLERLDEATGEYQRLNRKLLKGLFFAPQGGTYQYIDASVRAGDTVTYRLMEKERKGKHNIYGPYPIVVMSSSAEVDARSGITSRSDMKREQKELFITGYDSFAREPDASTRKRYQAVKEKWRDRLLKLFEKYNGSPWNQAPVTETRIALGETGLYAITAADIAAEFNVSEIASRRWIQKNRLSLEHRGKDIAIFATADNSALLFYGQKIDSIYTDTNVYTLSKRWKGKSMAVVSGSGPIPVDTPAFYTELLDVEQDLMPVTTLPVDPDSDYWYWDFIYATPDGASKLFTLPAPGAANTLNDKAFLKIRLQGFSADPEAFPDHHVRVLLNDIEIGQTQWDGATPHVAEFSFDQMLLLDGENTVEIIGTLGSDVNQSLFLIDGFELRYQRWYQAVGNQLLVRGGGNATVTVEGFSNDSIQVFDVSNPLWPKLIQATTIDEIGGVWRVSFTPADEDTPYFVVADSAWLYPSDMSARASSDLKNFRNRADHLIITPDSLEESAQELADYRNTTGLNSQVVNLQAIYDEFNDGIASPYAIRDFLRYAYRYWRMPPQYVVLLGDGTFDYKDQQGYGDNLVPPLMVQTEWGLFAADGRFGDVVKNDGIPEIAIGRLPVLSAEELAAYIEKLIAYESAASASWNDQIILAADNPDSAGDFSANSDALAGLVGSDYSVKKVYLGELGISEGRQQFLDYFNMGAKVINYIGHGAPNLLADEGLFRSSDISGLYNGDQLPVFSALTCSAGRFDLPGYAFLSEALITHSRGGAIACWSPSGFSYNADAVQLNRGLFQALFMDGENILGDAVSQSLKYYGNMPSSKRFMLDNYNLLGDPGTRLH